MTAAAPSTPPAGPTPEPPRPPLSTGGWLAVLAGFVVGVVVLAGGGFLINRTLSDANSSTASGTAAAESSSVPPSAPVAADPAAVGETVTVTPAAVLPTCATLPPAIDSTGRPHAYEATNTIDGDVTTAWRCQGARGQTLAVSFPCSVHLATVGIDPGHDKTDPDGADRFTQNRKVTRVAWTFDDGTTVEQQVAPQRGIQSMPVDQTARTATLTVLDTVDGQPVTNQAGQQSAPFNDVTSICEVRFTARAGDSGDGCLS